MAGLTPMMQQYMAIKEQCPDCILFFRLGDFYEMFNDDAKLASEELDLVLTTRDRGKDADEQTPMCGVPYHSCEAYIARLIQKGYKVAICEQTEDPATAKGLVDRDIVRIITPGTVIDSGMLTDSKNNYISSVYADTSGAAMCFADISTGEMQLLYIDGSEWLNQLQNELFGVAPVECVLGGEAARNEKLISFLKTRLNCRCETALNRLFEPLTARERLENHFGSDFESPVELQSISAAGGLLGYLYETQKTDLKHIQRLARYSRGEYLELDVTARRNLELTRTIRSGDKRGSLLWVLDKTKTAMGQRFLRAQLERPLMNLAEIRRRQEAVGELVKNAVLRGELRFQFGTVNDLERLMGRIVYGNANARDLRSLAQGLTPVSAIKASLKHCTSPMLRDIENSLDELKDMVQELEISIVDDPPFSVREGGIIRRGYSIEADKLSDIINGGSGMLADIESREKEKTGIKSLKVGYNRVFGYYIEVSKSYYGQVPENYIRKQTLANCERYITEELKELENTILTARERSVQLEYEIFCTVRENVARRVDRVQRTAAALSKLDLLQSFAQTAEENGYVCPEVDISDMLEIRDGRHPVVEQTLKNSLFVPNDTEMDVSSSRVAIITGPNMAGKSTYMRQVALIVIMAQIGSFVPAKSARIGLVDKVFTRVGASDDLSSGYSTFMMEMIEMAEILKNATSRSLLILDEIGRGTSTFDGMAIARSVLEYCADKRRLGAKTLFATHYHELTILENELDGVKNYNIAAKKRGDEIIFLRKIVRGSADDSYGIEVAKLAGIPKNVVKRAREILSDLEAGTTESPVATATDTTQVSMADINALAVAQQLRKTDLNTLTPLEAMNLLYDLKNKL